MPSPTPSITRILLVDDHAVVRDGLTAILSSQSDMEVVGAVESARAGLEEAERLRPELLLLDLRLPQLDGLTAVSVFRERFPSIIILMLSSADGDKAIKSCLDAGARGYVLKSAPASELLAAIRTVAGGGTYLSPQAAVSMVAHSGGADLTPREIEILESVSEGQSNSDVAASLGLAEKTVKNHLSNIFVKLGASDRTHAVTIALQRGIIELPRRAGT